MTIVVDTIQHFGVKGLFMLLLLKIILIGQFNFKTVAIVMKLLELLEDHVCTPHAKTPVQC
jgi:hypothetical protein